MVKTGVCVWSAAGSMLSRFQGKKNQTGRIAPSVENRCMSIGVRPTAPDIDAAFIPSADIT
jgi:hypothetical protein